VAVPNILESALTISFLSLHLPIDKPECVDVSREVPKKCQADVNKQIAGATCNECSCCGREEDGYDDENNVG